MGSSTQAIRDAAVLLLLILLVATVRVTRLDPAQETQWVPGAQAASALPAFFTGHDAASVPAEPAPPAPETVDLDLDLEFGDAARGWTVVRDGDERILQWNRDDQGPVGSICPAGVIVIRTSVATGDTVVPRTQTHEVRRVQAVRISRQRVDSEEKNCST